MLLPDNINPEYSLYYNGAIILEELKTNKTISVLDLFIKVRKKKDISFNLFLLCLDWLYLIDSTEIDKKGNINYVFEKINNRK